jgi:choline dehydrogenase-like flavoprotein
LEFRRRHQLGGAHEVKFDVVIVGSGAGGAPVAQRLAASGMKVLMIERGKRWNRQEFEQRDEIEHCRRDKFTPSILTDPHTRRNDEGMKANPTVDGWTSTILGGGTVHMSGFFLRALPEDAKQGTRLKDEKAHTAIDWAVPFDDIAKYFPIVEDEMGVSGVDGGKLPGLAEHELAKKADSVVKKMGLPIMRTPRAILTEPRPDEDRLSCAYRLVCASYGCPNDARGSMAVTYIRRGEKTGNVTIWTEAVAKKILGANGVATGVVVRRNGADETVEAGSVVVACSALESARLLLLSGDGFNPGGQVGKNLWFSLYVDVNGWFPKNKFPEAMSGSPFIHRSVNYGGKLSADDQKKYNIDRSGTLDLLWQHDNPIHRAERLATENGLLWGSALKKKMKVAFLDGRTMLCEGFGESIPHPGAYIDLDPETKDSNGLPVARITHWHHPRDGRVAQQLADSGTKILQELGAEDVRVRVSLGETVILQGGTCRFANEAKDGPTSPEGKLHGWKNLYVTDGGAIPSSLTVPVTLTIVANALRIADGMKKGT